MGSWRNRLGILLVAIWLILTGLSSLITTFVIPPILLALLAIAAGVVLLLEGRGNWGRGRGPRNLGWTLLAVWLILTGLLPLLAISFAYQGVIMALLALAAGVLLLIGR